MWYVRYKSALRHRAEVMTLGEVRARIEHDPVYLISPRLFPTAAYAASPGPQTPARYVPAVDVDALWCPRCGRCVELGEHKKSHPDHTPHLYGRPELAVRQALAFANELARDYDLRLGEDWDIGLTGGKGARLVLRYAFPLDVDQPRAWVHFLRAAKERYPLIDPNVGSTDTLRWLGARHPSKDGQPEFSGGWSAAVAPGTPLSEWPRTTSYRSPVEHRALWLPDPSRELPSGALRLHRDVDTAWRTYQLATQAPPRRASARYRSKDWRALLEGVGLATRVKSGATGWLQLAECPLCHHRDGSVHADSGTLYCFSAGCEAHDGLSAGKWAPGIGIDVSAAKSEGVSGRYPFAARGKRKVVRLSESREHIAEVVNEAFQNPSGRCVLLAATPGSGKSHAVAHGASEAVRRGERTAIAMPTTEMAREMENAVRQMNFAARVERLAPRDKGNCFYPARVAAAAALGWSPGRTVCARCEERDRCGYYRLRRRAQDADVVVGAWESTLALSGAGALGAINHLVVDEAPMRSIVSQHIVTADDILRWSGHPAMPAAGDAVEALIDLLREAIQLHRAARGKHKARVSRLEGEAIRELLGDGAEAIEAAAVEASGFTPPAGWLGPRRSDDAVRDAPGRGTLELFRAVASLGSRGDDTPAVPLAIQIGLEGGAHFVVGSMHRPRKLPSLCLDAYGDPRMYAAMLGSPVEHVRIDVAEPGTLWWWVPTPSSRAAIARNAAPLYEAAEAAERATSDMKGTDAWRGLIVAHGSELKWIREGDDAGRWDTRKYGQGAGTNLYAGHDVVMCLGTPRWPPEDVRMLAATLHQGEAALALDDERVEHIEAWVRDSEIAQSAHRVRPVFGGRQVWLVTDTDCALLPKPRRVSARVLAILGAALRSLRETGRWSTADAEGQSKDVAEVRRILDDEGFAGKDLRGGAREWTISAARVAAREQAA